MSRSFSVSLLGTMLGQMLILSVWRSQFIFIACRLTSEPVSIVFVHGLMGDRHKTWRGTSSNGVKLEPWPKLLLSKDIPRSRILSFGYDARVINKDNSSGRIPAESASEHARELVYTLRDFRSDTRTVGRKIMFICHSLGGIVCKDVC